MKKCTLRVYVLSYNRLAYLEEAVESALQQDFPDFEICISENSTDPNVRKAVLDKYGNSDRVKVISRETNLTAIEHFNTVMREAEDTEFFIQFHDDDIMSPQAMARLMNEIKVHPNIGAISANAYVLRDSIRTEQLFNPNLKSDTLFNHANDFVRQYFISDGINTPFSTYLYRTEKVKGLKISGKEGGKHADLTFLAKIVSRAPVFMLSEPLFYYRKHAENDSNSVSLKAVFSLKRSLKKLPNMYSDDVDAFVEKSLIKWTWQYLKKYSPPTWRERIFIKCAFKLAFTHSYFLLPIRKFFSYH